MNGKIIEMFKVGDIVRIKEINSQYTWYTTKPLVMKRVYVNDGGDNCVRVKGIGFGFLFNTMYLDIKTIRKQKLKRICG